MRLFFMPISPVVPCWYIKTHSTLLAAGFGAAETPQQGEYVVFSMDYLRDMALMIRSNAGAIFSVALYTFLLLLGIKIIINIVSYFSG